MSLERSAGCLRRRRTTVLHRAPLDLFSPRGPSRQISSSPPGPVGSGPSTGPRWIWSSPPRPVGSGPLHRAPSDLVLSTAPRWIWSSAGARWIWSLHPGPSRISSSPPGPVGSGPSTRPRWISSSPPRPVGSGPPPGPVRSGPFRRAWWIWSFPPGPLVPVRRPARRRRYGLVPRGRRRPAVQRRCCDCSRHDRTEVSVRICSSFLTPAVGHSFGLTYSVMGI
jgi:hypothetical protein